MQQINRRTLLKAGAGVAAVSSLGMPNGAVARRTTKIRHHLRRSTYLPIVGTDFKVRSYGGGSTKLRLLEVKNLAYPRKPDARVRERAFALHFVGPSSSPLGSETYRLRHSEMGTFDLWVSSGTLEKDGYHYVVVVNNAKVKAARKDRPRRKKNTRFREGENRSDRGRDDSSPRKRSPEDRRPEPRESERAAPEAAAPAEPAPDAPDSSFTPQH